MGLATGFWAPLAVFLVVLVAGLAITVPAYARLLRWLESDHAEDFERIGRPALFNASPSKSMALQHFLYVDSRSALISSRVSKVCRLLRVATPLYVCAIFVTLGWLLYASLAAL